MAISAETPTKKRYWAERFSRVPTPLGGLALGIASLGASWAIVLPEQSEWLKLVASLLAALLLLNIVVKFLLNPHLIKEDLTHPVVSSVMPTCAMAMMLIAQSLLPIAEVFAKTLWIMAVITHLALLVGFVVHRVRDFALEQMVPSWFVPPVGIIVAAVTSTGMGFESIVKGIFIFGIGCYFFKLPIMIYRLLFKTRIPEAALPTFAIMAAPASLSLAGYLTITDTPNLVLVGVLAPLAIFMTGIVYIAFIKLLRLPFSPGYAAFTFPMVIGATALLKLEDCLNGVLANLVYKLGLLELGVATLIVSYVFIRYVRFYLFPQHKIA